MRIYQWQPSPNSRRVRIYLEEKGITVPIEEVGDGAKLRSDYVAKYRFGTVPMLELADGTQIGEAMAICRYFETLHPEPPLMGTDARDKAIVEMWEHRAYDEGIVGVSEIFRNQNPRFKDRGLVVYGDVVPQIPELIERGLWRTKRFFRIFDSQLSRNEFVAGTRYTIADITALCSVDFGKMVEMSIPEDCPNMRRWYEAISARPSASA